jgi:hypothetical protein
MTMKSETLTLAEETAVKMLEKVKFTVEKETTPDELRALPEVANSALEMLKYLSTVG